MKKNEGQTDRIIRVIVGAVLLYLYFGGIVAGLWGTIALIVGVIAIITAFVGFCPLYSLLKINTKKS